MNWKIKYIIIISAISVFMLHACIIATEQLEVTVYPFLRTPAWMGVWCFFFLAGYKNGCSFFWGRYTYSFNGIISFYKRRFFRVIFPTWLFVMVVFLLIIPDYISRCPEVLLRVFTCTYRNDPATIIGATWYVSTLAWLYIVTPLLTYCLYRVVNSEKGRLVILFVVICIVGLLRIHHMRVGVNYNLTLMPMYMNMDLYTSGIIVAGVHPKQCKKGLWDKLLAIILLLLFVLAGYFQNHKNITGVTEYLPIYQYFLPTVVLVVLVLFFYIQGGKNAENCFEIWILDCFINSSLYFYLVHSLVALQLARALKVYFERLGITVFLLGVFLVSFLIAAFLNKAQSCICGVQCNEKNN